MKNRKHQANKAECEPMDTFAGSLPEGMPEDIVGTKVLYNWLYQEEEENYYLDVKVSNFFPDFLENEALFVEF